MLGSVGEGVRFRVSGAVGLDVRFSRHECQVQWAGMLVSVGEDVRFGRQGRQVQ